MFTPDERQGLREELVAAARADRRITGAALTGSAAAGREDRWSDIDLVFCVGNDAESKEVITDWTTRMYEENGAVAHMDVTAGHVLYRVFLLASTLQVDLAFSPPADFGAIAPTFRLLFGSANDRPPSAGPTAPELIGWAWLYALHARSSIERLRVWQAEYMISGTRDHVLALACLRHGVPAVQGRGMDRLPPEVTAAMTRAIVCSLDAAELKRAFGAVTEALLVEIGLFDGELASRLASPLREMAGGGDHDEPEMNGCVPSDS